MEFPGSPSKESYLFGGTGQTPGSFLRMAGSGAGQSDAAASDGSRPVRRRCALARLCSCCTLAENRTSRAGCSSSLAISH